MLIGSLTPIKLNSMSSYCQPKSGRFYFEFSQTSYKYTALSIFAIVVCNFYWISTLVWFFKYCTCCQVGVNDISYIATIIHQFYYSIRYKRKYLWVQFLNCNQVVFRLVAHAQNKLLRMHHPMTKTSTLYGGGDEWRIRSSVHYSQKLSEINSVFMM